MKFLTFTGDTPANALKKAQKECGEDAVVISTKQIQKKTINQDSIYEVVVGLDENARPIKPAVKKINPRVRAYTNSDDVIADISEAARQISKIANVSSPSAINDVGKAPSYFEDSFSKKEDKLNIDETSMKEIGEIKKEINKLMDKVKTIQEMFWDEKYPHKKQLAIPPEFSQIYKLAFQSGMSQDHLNTIMYLTLEHMPSRMKENTETIKRYFHVLLRKMIPVRVESSFDKNQQKIMMLVGPTGVGKTTTLAKLAARYSYLKDKRYKVGIITLDTYRIGAVEQLFQYAKMMKLPIEDVVDVNDFQSSLQSLNFCDIILIDTVGSSQYDKEKLARIDRFLKTSTAEIGVNLVLSAGTKLEDLREIYNGFSFLDIDTLIFTKFDETRMFGNVFSLIYDIKKPISYFSTGQEVPDDLKLATSEYLIECMLDGFKRAKNGKSS